MATRTPGLQTRSQFGNYWGVYATAPLLPNASIPSALAAPQFKLEQGDIAYVQGVGFYQCDSAGTAGAGDAVWSQIGFASVTQDRFAPTYLVGNTPAGDSATAYSAGGFNYYPDIGDGAQLQAALTACSGSADGGVVYVRRGTYDLNQPGAPAVPLAVGARTIVQGEGVDSTKFTGKTTGDQGVFRVIGARSALRDLFVGVTVSGPGSLGSDALIYFNSDYSELRNINVALETDVAGQLKEGIRFDGAGLLGRPVSVTNVSVVSGTATGSGAQTICFRTVGTDCVVDARQLVTSGGDVGVAGSTPLILWDARLTDWEQYGLNQKGANPLRCYSSRLEASSGAPVGALGMFLQNTGGIDISGVSVRTTSIGHPAGVRIADNGVVIPNIAMRALVISGYETGIELGNTSLASSPSAAFVNDCDISANNNGILVAAQSVAVQVKNNRVVVNPVTGAAGYGIRYETGGSQAQCDGNDVSVTDSLNGAYGIRMQCTGTVRGNRVLQDGCLWGIEIDGAAAQCMDNDVIAGSNVGVDGATGAIHLANQTLIRAMGNYASFPQTTFTSPAILVEGTLAQVSMNTTVVTAGVNSPGIRLAGPGLSSNCNAIGNICQGSTSVTGVVEDLGSTNNLSNNIAA
jgi:hypothetical protein